MEQISAANIQAMQPTIQKKQEKIEAQTAPKISSEDTAKLTGALAGLAVTGLAAVALLKKGKGKEVVDDMTKKAVQVAQDVSEQIAKGKSVNSVKKEATHGFSHNAKKIIKAGMAEGRDAKLANEALIRQNIIKQTTNAKAAPTAAKSLSQGVKSASNEVLQQKVINADLIKKQATESAETMKKIAKETPTRRNKKLAQYTYNQAEKARVNAEHTKELAEEAMKKQAEKSARKAQTIAAQQASPNYAQAQINMQKNAQKSAEKAIKRTAQRDMNKPAYKTMMSLLDSHVKAGRTDVAESIAKKALNSNKKVEAMAAQDFLATITK